MFLSLSLINLVVPGHAQLKRCSKERDTSGGGWEIITISKAKGGLGLVALGSTQVRFWTKSGKVAFRVTHGHTKQELKLNKPGLMTGFYEALFTNPKTQFHLDTDPTQNHFFEVQKTVKSILSTQEELCYSAEFTFLSMWRVLPLMVGILIFFKAKTVTEQIGFHYTAGVSMGVGLFAIGLLIIIARLVPKRGFITFWGVIAGGTGFLSFLAAKFYSQASDFIETYPFLVIAYILISAALSFTACYWYEDSMKHPKYQRICCWFLQLIGLVLIGISSWNLKFNIFIGGVVLAIEMFSYGKRHGTTWFNFMGKKANFTTESPRNNVTISPTPSQRPNFFSPIANLRRIPMRFRGATSVGPALFMEKKFLTNDEYEDEGERETTNAIEQLKESISNSPNPWKVLSKLSKETQSKLIDFVETGDHLQRDLFDDMEENEETDSQPEMHHRMNTTSTIIKQTPTNHHRGQMNNSRFGATQRWR